MRPPILYLTLAFAAGLITALSPYVVRGAWYVVLPVLAAAAVLHRRAPLGAAVGVMFVAGLMWGASAGPPVQVGGRDPTPQRVR